LYTFGISGELNDAEPLDPADTWARAQTPLIS
jgi:hypothetical protein